MKKALLLFVLIGQAIQPVSYSALLKPKMSPEQLIPCNGFTPDLQNILFQYAYGKPGIEEIPNRETVNQLITKIGNNERLDCNDFDLIDNVFATEGLLALFDAYNNEPHQATIQNSSATAMCYRHHPDTNHFRELLAQIKDQANHAATSILFVACANGRIATIKGFLASGVNIESQNTEGQTPLHYAVKHRRTNIIELLLTHHANPNAGDHNSRTPLHDSVDKSNILATELLIRAGANPNSHDKYGNTPLHIAAIKGNKRSVQMLISAGANPEARNEESLTPLHIAALNGDCEMAEILLTDKANPTTQTKDGQTALHIATTQGRSEIVRTLCQYRWIVNIQTKDGETALHLAADLDYSDCIKVLLEAGANPYLTDIKNHTPLDFARKSHARKAIKLLAKLHLS